MKTSLISVVGKGVSIGILAMFLVSCGEKTQTVAPQQTVTQAKDEPAWILDPQEGKKIANAPVVGVASHQVLSGNLNYALNQATMQARAQIAQTISAKMKQVIESKFKGEANAVGGGGQEATRQKVDTVVQSTEVSKKWIDKSVDPNVIYVLVSMDKEAYENAKKSVAQGFNFTAQQYKDFSDSVDDLLSRE